MKVKANFLEPFIPTMIVKSFDHFFFSTIRKFPGKGCDVCLVVVVIVTLSLILLRLSFFLIRQSQRL